MALAVRSSILHQRHVQPLAYVDSSDSEEEQDEPEVIPQFQYNRCVFVAFLPCFVFILSLTGEM